LLPSAGSALLIVGAAPSMIFLIGARALQGVGGGTIFSCVFATLGDLFTPAERAAIDHPPATHATAAPPPRLDGIVSPRSGTPTLFVDGRARPAIPQQIRLDEASAEVPGPDGRLHRLRVGAPPDAPTP
jgi:hypothetical protein